MNEIGTESTTSMILVYTIISNLGLRSCFFSHSYPLCVARYLSFKCINISTKLNVGILRYCVEYYPWQVSISQNN